MSSDTCLLCVICMNLMIFHGAILLFSHKYYGIFNPSFSYVYSSNAYVLIMLRLVTRMA